MRKSIFTKAFGGHVLIILALSAMIVTLSFRVVRDYYIHRVTENLKNLGETMKEDICPCVVEGRYEELNAYARELGPKISTRITVIDPAGAVIADSEKNPLTMENHGNRPEVKRALQGHVGTFSRYSTTVKEDMVYVALPLRSESGIIAVLRLSRFEKDVSLLLSELKRKIIELAGVVMVFSLVIAFFFTRSLAKPIRDLRVAFQRVASGDFDVKLYITSQDETRELADSFNAMTDQIKALFIELSRQKDSLNSIIASVQAGLAVLDKSGKIVQSNKSFEKISRNPRVEGKFYWEAIRAARFGEVIKKATEEKKSLTGEVELNGRSYLCSATPLDARDETVVMVHDITEMKNIEKVKRDFVVNVSHELRTPLAAIKGFAETLEDDVSEDARRYVEVIKRNTDRLIYIIEDLLVLSELEEKGHEMTVEGVDLTRVIEHVARIFHQRLEQKNLTLDVSMSNELPLIKGDMFRLEQLFINLIDNAVKYTDKGGIMLAVIPREASVEIVVEDTGIGIRKEHLARIFERFYVVDKGRAKKLGGTGLGLSIVKHIVLLHRGEIQVESILGMGTKFIVTLPVE